MADKEDKKVEAKAEEKKPEAVKEVKEEKTADAASTEETAVKKVKKSKNKRTVIEGNAYIQSTFNNTMVSITDLDGNILSWSSAGANGFKGAKKATPYAAQVAAEAAATKALTYGIERLHVFVKGVGSGRDQAIRGLHMNTIAIESITDVTPVAHNGCRPRKARRV